MGLFEEECGRVARLTPDKASPAWVHVIVGGRRAGRVPAAKIAALGLTVGCAWTPDMAARASLAAEALRARLKAIALLRVRGRSAAQLASRLARSGFSSAAAGEAIAELAAEKLIDDAGLADSGARAALGKGLSSAATRARLVDAGVSQEVAAAAVAGADPGDELSRAIEQARNRAARLSESLEPSARYRRVLAALARLGYEEDVARQAVAAVMGGRVEG